MAASREIKDGEYSRLLEFRTGLRTFLQWSESQARAAGITPSQHQLMLAIKGHGDPRGPSIGNVAAYLLLRHHSAVGLVDRAELAGLVARCTDPADLRVVRLRVTPKGERILNSLVAVTLQELTRMRPQLNVLWDGIGGDGSVPRGTPRTARTTAAGSASARAHSAKSSLPRRSTSPRRSGRSRSR